MEKACNPTAADAAHGLTVTFPEFKFLVESDDEEEMAAQLSPEAFGIKEELVQKVMQELYNEITKETTGSLPAVEPPVSPVSTDGNKGSHKPTTAMEGASPKAVAGVPFDANGNAGQGRSQEELQAEGGALTERRS